MYKKTTTTVEEFFDNNMPQQPPMAPIPAARSINPRALKPVIRLDVPLMIRLLEYAREEPTSDIAVHQMVEKMIDLCQYGEVLEMSDYDDIIEVIVQEEEIMSPMQASCIPVEPAPPPPAVIG